MIGGKVLSNAVAISADCYGLALRSDGVVVGWGDSLGQAMGADAPYFSGPVLTGGKVLDNVVSIAAANSFSLAVKRDSTVVAWGKCTVPSGLSNVVAISAHEFNCLAVKKDGTVVGWTSAPWSSMQGKLYELSGLSNVVAIAVGGAGNVAWNTALKQDGSLVVWRTSLSEQEVVPSGFTNVLAIAAGTIHTLALKSDGTVIGFGYNADGQATGVPTNQAADDAHLSSGCVMIGGQALSNVVAVAAYGNYSLALKNDGSIAGWGKSCPKIPDGLSNVVAIAAGDGFCLAITTNAAVAARFLPQK